jgi:TPR repeat protein
MDESPDIPVAQRADSFCERCGNDLERLAPGAKFCPRCGMEVSRGVEVQQIRVVEPVPVAWPVFQQHDPSRFHSVMVVGYARALNSLGTRYEAGMGVARNTDEALRYYCKAARLGSGDALKRLAKRGFSSPDAVALPVDSQPAADDAFVDCPEGEPEATSADSLSDLPAPPEATEQQNP